MALRNSTYVTNNIYLVSAPVMMLSRICGLAPLSVTKTRGQMFLRWSTKYAIYSWLLAMVLASWSVVGVVRDLQAVDGKKVRMKKSLRNITCVDISVVIVTVLISIFGTRGRLPKLLTFINCLNEIDALIYSYNTLKARKTVIALMSAVFGTTLVVLGIDFYAWHSTALKQNASLEFLFNYMPFYVLYCIVIVMEFQFFHMADTSFDNGAYQIADRIIDVTTEFDKNVVGNLIDNLKKVRRISDVKAKARAISEEYVAKLIKTHEKIFEAVTAVTDSYGLTLLIIILSCLLHLIVTPYFLLMEINDRKDPKYVSLQIMWIAAHICRLLLIVEPCHSCVKQAKSTSPLVCKLLGYDIGESTRKQLEIFAIQCVHRQIEFSACGLAKIDRQLLTGMAGAVTTYLVILFQFEKNN